MPPRGYAKRSTTAAPQLLGAALNIVSVLRETTPGSMNLAMAETCLEKELASLTEVPPLVIEPPAPLLHGDGQ